MENSIEKSNSLFEITQEHLDLINEIMEAGGELTPELEEKLKINESELMYKAGGYIGILRKTAGDRLVIKSEINRLKALDKQRENLENRLKNALSTSMQLYDKDKIELPYNTISFRKTTSVAVYCEPEDLPKDCQVIKITSVSKAELKKKIQSGRVIDGVEIIEGKSLQIK